MPFRLGPLEIGLILVIILIVFGVGKLPQVGGAIGKGIRNFKKAQAGEDIDDDKSRGQTAGKTEDKSEKKTGA